MVTAVSTPAAPVAPTKADRKAAQADKAFVLAYGHPQSECLPGCTRIRGRGEAKAPVHRNSLARPGENAGRPFAETYEEKLIRRALKRNGIVTTVAPATPEAPKPVGKRTPPTAAQANVLAQFAAVLDTINSTLTVITVRLDRLEAK